MLKGTGSISGLHRVLAVFRGPHPADTADTPFTSRFCRDCLYSGSCTTHAPSTRSIWAFSIAHTRSTRQYFGRQHYNALSVRSTQYTRYSQVYSEYGVYLSICDFYIYIFLGYCLLFVTVFVYTYERLVVEHLPEARNCTAQSALHKRAASTCRSERDNASRQVELVRARIASSICGSLCSLNE